MKPAPEPPKKYSQFIERFPKLGEAWEAIHQAEEEGPLDLRTSRLVKLAVAIGAFREGAAHAAVRKALKAGATPEELQQVVVLATATLGMPGAVAAFGWVQDVVDKDAKKD